MVEFDSLVRISSSIMGLIAKNVIVSILFQVHSLVTRDTIIPPIIGTGNLNG